MQKIGLTLVGLTMTVLVSCTNEVEKSWEHTLHVHDDVMLIMQENGEIEKKLDELIHRGKQDTNSVLFTKVDTLQTALDKLAHADEEMMDWMATLRSPQEGQNPDSAIAYYQERAASIITIGEHMKQAARDAEDLLKSLEK